MKEVVRYQNLNLYEKLSFLCEETMFDVNFVELMRTLKVDSIVKLQEHDHNELLNLKGAFTHFNIQCSGHLEDKDYLLLKISEPGYFDGDKEIPPKLDFKGAFLVKCEKVINNVSYETLSESDFEHSIESIKNAGTLRDAIIRRYQKSLSHISDEEKIKMGVGISKFKILREVAPEEILNTENKEC